MVEMPRVISSSTSSSTRTVSSAVSMVTPFSTAQRRIWLEPAVHILTADVHGVDDVGDIALTDANPESRRSRRPTFARTRVRDAVLLQENRGAHGGLDVEAQLVEPADQGQRFLLVLVGDGHEYSAVIFHASCPTACSAL